jgi:xylose isomerase
MDAFARGLKTAARIRADGVLKDFVKKRYASWDSGIGQQVESGKAKFEDLEKYTLDRGDASRNVSGRQEMLENVLNRYFELG